MEEYIKHSDLHLFILRKGCTLDVTQAISKSNKGEYYKQQNEHENKERNEEAIKNYEGGMKNDRPRNYKRSERKIN
jgi:hypothetical protein